jgi:hypothetical protein
MGSQRNQTMTAVLLFTLFAGTAFLAIGAMAVSWKQYGPAALAIRGQLRECSPTREVRYRIIEMKVQPAALNSAPATSAKIYRPRFRPVAQPALRAAA